MLHQVVELLRAYSVPPTMTSMSGNGHFMWQHLVYKKPRLSRTWYALTPGSSQPLSCSPLFFFPKNLLHTPVPSKCAPLRFSWGSSPPLRPTPLILAAAVPTLPPERRFRASRRPCDMSKDSQLVWGRLLAYLGQQQVPQQVHQRGARPKLLPQRRRLGRRGQTEVSIPLQGVRLRVSAKLVETAGRRGRGWVSSQMEGNTVDLSVWG